MAISRIYISQSQITELRQKARQVMRDKTLETYGRVAREVIETEGEFADLGIKGDIVDTGRLRDSQRINELPQTESLDEWLVEWNPVNPETEEAYAAKVWSGFTSFSGRWIPGRDWPGRASEKMDLVNEYPKDLRDELGI